MSKELEEGLELAVQFEKRGGLIPVVTQDIETGEVLMLAYANQEALDTTLTVNKTLGFRCATYWSTSRNELWTKGKTSGDILEVKKVLVDCDQDALVYRVKRHGKGACHTKGLGGETRRTCFYRRVTQDGRLEFIEDME